MGTLFVLHEVDDGVDGPARHGIIGVVAMADTEHAEDSARLAHLEAIFFPDWHGAKGQEAGLDFGMYNLIYWVICLQ